MCFLFYQKKNVRIVYIRAYTKTHKVVKIKPIKSKTHYQLLGDSGLYKNINIILLLFFLLNDFQFKRKEIENEYNLII